MSVVYFLMFGAVGALSPYLSLYYKSVGLSATESSLLLSITPFLLFVSQPVLGVLTDRSGHRGRMFARLLLFVAATGSLMALGTSFAALLPLVLLWSFIAGVLTPIADSIALGEAARIGVAFPRLRLWGSIGFLLVTFAVGKLYGLTTYRVAFPIYGALMLITWYFARKLPADGVADKRSIWPALKEMLRNRQMLLFLLLSAVMSMAQAAHAAFFSVHLTSIGGSSSTVGLAWALAAAVEVPVWLVLGDVTRRVGANTVLATAGVVYALRWYLYSVVTVPGVLVGLQVLQGLSFGLFMPTAVIMVGEMAPPELRTSGQALLSLVNGGLATILGTLASGRIIDSMGTAGLYRVASYVALLSGAGFVLLLVVRQMQKSRGAAVTKL